MSSSTSSKNTILNPYKKPRVNTVPKTIGTTLDDSNSEESDDEPEELELEHNEDEISSLAGTPNISLNHSFDKGILQKRANVTNSVWRSFKVWSKAPWIAVCLLCQAVEGAACEIIIRSEKKNTSVSTSKLTRHMASLG